MAVNLEHCKNLLKIDGVSIGISSAGIKKPGRQDVVLFALAAGSKSACMLTQNAFAAAPVIVAKTHWQQSAPRYLLVNTGNANAGTGSQGVEDALRCCRVLAQTVGCQPEEVLPFSTGVIGEYLPTERIVAVIPQLVADLNALHWEAAAYGIMTTDTIAKGFSTQIEVGGCVYSITGIAKGSGMICPDMATMLAFIATDAPVKAEVLQACLKSAVDNSFNRTSVDGDSSTNDAVVLVATGLKGGVGINSTTGVDYHRFNTAITQVCQFLAQAIVRDAEGATKFISISVQQGRDDSECRQVAYTLAHSPLIKTAFFASDPNWGRIIAAIGRAGLKDLDISGVSVFLNEVPVVTAGCRHPDYREDQGQQVMQQAEISITVRLNRGDGAFNVWTSDLSHEYVRINSDYRS